MSSINFNNLPVEIVRKRIKNIYLRVYPASKRIKISAPMRMSENDIQIFLNSKSGWLQKQLDKSETFKKKIASRKNKYITGDKHLIWGNEYFLNIFIHNNPSEVKLNNNKIDLFIRKNSSLEKRKKILNTWRSPIVMIES